MLLVMDGALFEGITKLINLSGFCHGSGFPCEGCRSSKGPQKRWSNDGSSLGCWLFEGLSGVRSSDGSGLNLKTSADSMN